MCTFKRKTEAISTKWFLAAAALTRYAEKFLQRATVSDVGL